MSERPANHDRLRDQRRGELMAALTLQIARGKPREVLEMIDPLLTGAIERGDERTACDLRLLRNVAISEHQREIEYGAAASQSDNLVMLMIQFAHQILPVVHRIATTGLNPVLAQQLADAFPMLEDDDADSDTLLSPREHQVLKLVSAGYSNRDIAASLSISEGTVKKHISNVLAKLHADNRTQAVAIARSLALF